MLFIYEGPDATGKTTQLERTAQWLRNHGVPVTTSREPGGSEIGRTLRQFMLGGAPIAPLAELFGMMMDRAQHHFEVIAPALERGDVVLCDRMFDSSLVYQGLVKGHGLHLVQQLNALNIQSPSFAPWVSQTVNITFSADPAVLEERLKVRLAAGASDDKHDAMGLEFRQRVRDAYDFVSAQVPVPYMRHNINADGTLDDVQHLLREFIQFTLQEVRGIGVTVNDTPECPRGENVEAPVADPAA